MSDTNDSEALVLDVGRVLHRQGTAAHRVEAVLEHLASQLGLQGSFFAVPTAIFAAFGPLGGQRSGLVRLDQGDRHLGKLARVDHIIARLLAGTLSPADAHRQIDAVDRAPDSYPAWLLLLAYGASSAAGASFFGGGSVEIGVSAIIGTLLGLLERTAGGGRGRFVFVPVAAALGSALAEAFQGVVGPYRADIVTLAGLLYLLPGLTLTVALTEISTRHLVSGTARLTLAVLILMELAFGVALGGRLGAAVPAGPPMASWVLPLATEPVAVAIAAMSFAALYRARAVDLPVCIGGGFVAFYSSRLGANLLDPQVGAFVGALALGIACNSYARVFDRPQTVPLVPALLLLVPGSLGLRSMTWLLQHETLKAVDTAFEMSMIAMSLAVGVLVANVLLPPRRTL